MAKYLVLWEIDWTKVPVDAKEKNTLALTLAELVKADMKKGYMKDWGMFPGELKGYAIAEGTEVAVTTEFMRSVPYAKHEVRVVASVAQVEEAIKALMK